MPAKNSLATHYASIGRLGGQAKTPAKRHAARLAALTRWGHGSTAAIPADDLTDGRWYVGKGRNADIGLWDSRNRTFWVTCVSDYVSPATYPEPGQRSVRLKRERHYNNGGSFRPLREIK